MKGERISGRVHVIFTTVAAVLPLATDADAIEPRPVTSTLANVILSRAPSEVMCELVIGPPTLRAFDWLLVIESGGERKGSPLGPGGGLTDWDWEASVNNREGAWSVRLYGEGG